MPHTCLVGDERLMNAGKMTPAFAPRSPRPRPAPRAARRLLWEARGSAVGRVACFGRRRQPRSDAPNELPAYLCFSNSTFGASEVFPRLPQLNAFTSAPRRCFGPATLPWPRAPAACGAHLRRSAGQRCFALHPLSTEGPPALNRRAPCPQGSAEGPPAPTLDAVDIALIWRHELSKPMPGMPGLGGKLLLGTPFSSFAAYGTAGLPRGKPLGSLRCRTSPPGGGGGVNPGARYASKMEPLPGSRSRMFEQTSTS